MIPPGFVAELLSRVDIAEIVGRHVQLKKGGANLMGLCPFHGEKSPSFSVSPSKQFYYCFGCGASGDAIRFLTEHTGASFRDAVADLAQQVGLTVPDDTRSDDERHQAAQAKARQATLTDVSARAADHYRKQLKADARAIDYLKGRGLSGEIAARFGIGYAPEGWRPLASAFAHYDDPLLVESGLVIVQGDEGPEQKRYDRFRDRIMFPIRSVQGETIGFGGRVLDRGEPKYLNSPETPLFVKGRELYGLFESRAGMRARGYALVVEGYMDVVALAQSGFDNAVATLGTACTDEHVRKLFRFTDSVVFSFDGDAAGQRAAGRLGGESPADRAVGARGGSPSRAAAAAQARGGEPRVGPAAAATGRTLEHGFRARHAGRRPAVSRADPGGRCHARSPLVLVDRSLPAARIVEALDTLLLVRCHPEAIVCDNGPEFVSLALDQWASQHEIRLDFIRPGHPVENASSRASTASCGTSA